MTEKQVKTLILFAQDYPIVKIAEIQEVCLSTVRERLGSLSRNHPREFGKALRIREVYKLGKEAIRNTINFSDFVEPSYLDGNYSTIEIITRETKHIF